MSPIAATVINQILIMFIIILIGIVCYKIKFIDIDMNKKLSNIVLMLVNPLLIFESYQREFDPALLNGLFISLGLAVITHVVGILISLIALRNSKQKADLAIERFAIIYSNCGFIGIPLINGIFGSEGVFYVAAYMTMFNIFAWTHGLITVSGKSDLKTVVKSLLSPSILATVVGFLLFVTKIMLPNIANQSLGYIAEMNTPLAMLVSGVTIAQTDILSMLKKIRSYYITFLKLLVIPIIMILIFRNFPISRIVMLSSILAVSCPTAVTINLFAIRFDKNYYYAAELFAMTTIMSAFSIPIVMMIADYLIK